MLRVWEIIYHDNSVKQEISGRKYEKLMLKITLKAKDWQNDLFLISYCNPSKFNKQTQQFVKFNLVFGCWKFLLSLKEEVFDFYDISRVLV